MSSPRLTRVPETRSQAEIAAIDGVAAVDTRIQKIALADIADMAEPASVAARVAARIIANRRSTASICAPARLPDPEADDEAVASAGFARAHGLAAGSTIRVLINGRLRDGADHGNGAVARIHLCAGSRRR